MPPPLFRLASLPSNLSITAEFTGVHSDAGSLLINAAATGCLTKNLIGRRSALLTGVSWSRISLFSTQFSEYFVLGICRSEARQIPQAS